MQVVDDNTHRFFYMQSEGSNKGVKVQLLIGTNGFETIKKERQFVDIHSDGTITKPAFLSTKPEAQAFAAAVKKIVQKADPTP